MAFFPWIVFGPVLVIVILAVVLTLWTPVESAIQGSNEFQVVTIVLTATALLVVAFALLRAWMSYYLDVTIVTERRLIDIQQRGIFVRRIAEQSLLRVQDVTARQKGFWQHFFNYGLIYIETAGREQNFELQNIPRPTDVATTIMNLHERLVAEGQREFEEVTAEGEVGPHGPAERRESRPRHPLEALQAFFPEPSLAQEERERTADAAEATAPAKAAAHPLIEAELQDGETITIPPDRRRRE